ncbi:MAG TPA: alginate lyase family protein [Streptosporangiaceae bacterium]|nr:alginate lyase family protein [Streptosporangiaceae bacterium]
MTGADLARLSRTVVHLRPSQVAHRARLRAQQVGLRRFPEAGRRVLSGPDPSAAVGWPAALRPVDARTPGRWPNLSDLRSGKITLLGLARELGDPPGWQHADAPRLWRFHLHYWDWAWGLAADPDRLAARALFARLWRSWRASTGFGRGDAWHPYPAALRAWSWCGLHHDLAAGSDLEPDFVAELAAHAGFLRRHLEYDVGGNHLIKGLKALTGLAVFFADERLVRLAARRMARQLTQQILADGGHYERAPAYHCQVLADLIDVADLLRATRQTPADEVSAAVDRMRSWLGTVLTPDGQVPLLNDGYPVGGEFLAALRPGSAPDDPLVVLPATGLVRAAVGGWHLLADVGPPCPPSLPAHAHADTFGCLVHVDGAALLVEAGTSTYEPGPTRRYERSTAGHSTVQVDGADSTEVWGAFRAGRRARVRGLEARADSSGVMCEAVHDGFRALRGRPIHRRRWSVKASTLTIEDTVTGRGRHEIVIRWQLAVGTTVQIADAAASVTTPAGIFRVAVSASTPVRLAVENRPVAAGFGSTADAPALTCGMEAAPPVCVTTVWSRARGSAVDERAT